MENMCDEILLKLFGYIDKEHEALRMTCRRFYQLICELNKHKFPLKISEDKLQDQATYDSIIHSERIFNKVVLNSNKIESLESFWKLRTICYQKGLSITDLLWDSAKMTSIEVITILNLFPNIQTLSCTHWKIKTEYFDESPNKLKLESLRKLNIFKCNEVTVSFFNQHLPPHILNGLTMDSHDRTFLENQKSLKELSLTDDELNDEWISTPLTSLTLDLRNYKLNGQPILQKILQQQTDLESLDIMRCVGIFDGDNNSFEGLCNLMNLKKLKINIDDLNSITFKENFNKLKNLEDLSIEHVEQNYAMIPDIIEEFSKIRLEKLSKLYIDLEHIGIPIDRIQRMGINFPQLREFKLRCELPLPLDIYFFNFKILKVLEINYHYTQDFSNVCRNLDNSQKFPNLASLKLEGFNFGSDVNLNEIALSKLINVLPNLKIFNVEINVPLNLRFLSNLVQKLPKIKSFKSLNFVHQHDNYEEFNMGTVLEIIDLSDKLEEFEIELKLKTIDIQDLHLMKEMFTKKFKFEMRKFGIYLIIVLKKS